jgi:DNA-binding transcriptional ArsR family regulator
MRQPSRPAPSTEAADDVWAALASRWRRRILVLLRRRVHATNEVWVALGPATLSRFAVLQHLDVLERAGLVLRWHRGRTTYNALNPLPLQRLCAPWLGKFRHLPVPQLARMRSPQAAEAPHHS